MFQFKPPKAGKLVSSKSIMMTIGVIIVLALLGTSVYIVNQAEEAVITRFGKYYSTQGPGLQFKLPFGIDRHYLVNVRELQAEEFRVTRTGAARAFRHTSESNMLTGDLNIVDVEWTIQYRISDSLAWTFNVEDRIATIRDVSRSVINQLVGDRAILLIMLGGRSVIEAEAVVMMNEILRGYGPGGLGIIVSGVQLQAVTPPAGEVEAAFQDVIVARQDRERLSNEGQEAYNREIPRTRGEAERMVLIAQGYATERVNRASGDVARFNSVLAEYQRSPDVTRQRLYNEMMEEVFSSEQDVKLIDHNLRNFLPMMNIGGR